MPHFGLMGEGNMTPEDAELLRARLHVRAARRRFRQGKIPAGISVLFDALISALRWYIASPRRLKRLKVKPGEDLNDERTIYEVLVRSGTLDGTPGYEYFNGIVEDAVNKRLSNCDHAALLGEVEAVLTRLGVMPFDESLLPPEDPGTP